MMSKQYIPSGYKQTKVGVVPEGWDEHLFNDVFIFSTGKNIKQNEASPQFKIPCVRYGELYHMYDEVITKVINKTNLDKSELLFSNGDEILLPSAGEDPLDIGSASALTLKDIAIGRTINILRPLKENVYSQVYISYYINHQLKTKIASLAKGSSISNVYNSDLKKLKIPIPPLKEQQKIAEILTTWDDAISKQEKLIKAKERLKKGLMQKLLSGEVRFAWFDEEWEEVKLGDVGKVITGSTPPTNNKANYGSEFLFVSPADIKHNKYVNNSEKKVSQIGFNISRKVSKGAILFVCIGSTIGKIAIANQDLITNQQINAIYSKNYSNEYIYYILFLNKERIKLLAGEQAVPLLNKSDFSKIKIPLPPLKEQQKIAQVLTTADKDIELLKKELESLKEQKKGLMQRLLSGEVRVMV